MPLSAKGLGIRELEDRRYSEFIGGAVQGISLLMDRKQNNEGTQRIKGRIQTPSLKAWIGEGSFDCDNQYPWRILMSNDSRIGKGIHDSWSYMSHDFRTTCERAGLALDDNSNLLNIPERAGFGQKGQNLNGSVTRILTSDLESVRFRLLKKSVEMMYKDIDRLIKTFNTTDYKKNKKAKKFIYTAQQLKLKLHMALSGITHNVREGKLTETLNKLTEKLSKSEIKKMKDKFDKTGKLPPHLVKLAKLIDKHTEIKNVIVPGLEWMADIDEGKVDERIDMTINNPDMWKQEKLWKYYTKATDAGKTVFVKLLKDKKKHYIWQAATASSIRVTDLKGKKSFTIKPKDVYQVVQLPHSGYKVPKGFTEGKLSEKKKTIPLKDVPSYMKDHYPTQKHWDYYQSLPKGKKYMYYKKYPNILAKQSKKTDDFIAQQKKELGLEGKLTEAKETIFDVAAKVMKDSQNYNYKSKKGMVKVDMQTANLLTKVWKKVSPQMKKHLAGMGESNPAGLVQTLWAAVK